MIPNSDEVVILPDITDNNFKMYVAVGSTNPVKIRATENGVRKCLIQSTTTLTPTTCPQVDIVMDCFDVESGVSDQPYGDEETIQGAKSRAKRAFDMYEKKHGRYPHLAFGLEGGLEYVDVDVVQNQQSSVAVQIAEKTRTLYCMAWMVVYGQRDEFILNKFIGHEMMMNNDNTTIRIVDEKPIFSMSKTSMFALPPRLVEEVEKGMELSTADDKIFKRVKSKQGSGTVGKLTQNVMDRTSYYENAIILALIPWMNPELYPYGIE